MLAPCQKPCVIHSDWIGNKKRMTVKVQEEKEEDEEVGDRGGGQKLEDCSKNQCGVVQGRHNRR